MYDEMEVIQRPPASEVLIRTVTVTWLAAAIAPEHQSVNSNKWDILASQVSQQVTNTSTNHCTNSSLRTYAPERLSQVYAGIVEPRGYDDAMNHAMRNKSSFTPASLSLYAKRHPVFFVYLFFGCGTNSQMLFFSTHHFRLHSLLPMFRKGRWDENYDETFATFVQISINSNIPRNCSRQQAQGPWDGFEDGLSQWGARGRSFMHH